MQYTSAGLHAIDHSLARSIPGKYFAVIIFSPLIGCFLRGLGLPGRTHVPRAITAPLYRADRGERAATWVPFEQAEEAASATR